MLARVAKAMNDKEKGFTLIELLVVIVIIGILSAIAIPAFMGQREKAVDSGVKSDLRTIATEVETFYVDNQKYPTTTELAVATGSVTLSGKAIEASDAGTVFTYTPSSKSFVLTGTNPKGTENNLFTYDSANGGLESTPNTGVTTP